MIDFGENNSKHPGIALVFLGFGADFTMIATDSSLLCRTPLAQKPVNRGDRSAADGRAVDIQECTHLQDMMSL